MKNINYVTFSTCLGIFYVAAYRGKIVRIDLGKGEEGKFLAWLKSHFPDASLAKKRDDGGILENAEKQIIEYAEGRRRKFDLPLVIIGTDFQIKIWNQLAKIPWGETRTYGQVAKSAGNPKASRAVGGACNKNPIPIVIPCHRVVGSDGSLVGFGGGLDMKKKLLEMEDK